MGSDRFGGSVYVVNPVDSFDSHSHGSYLGQVHDVASLSYTIWTADCSSINNQAVVGMSPAHSSSFHLSLSVTGDKF